LVGGIGLLDSKAITKIQSIILIAIIVIAAVGGVVAYVLLDGEDQSSETIKIGILTDLDATQGNGEWQAAILAAEQINAEGGILGRQVKIIGEDTDGESGLDMAVINTAITRLIFYHKVDFIIGGGSGEAGFMCQDVAANNKKILLTGQPTDGFTERVADDYEKYKYFFRFGFNASSSFHSLTNALVLLREQTGFNKIGYLAEDIEWSEGVIEGLNYVLPENGFDLVYKGKCLPTTVDFSSYFAAAEAAGVEILVPLIALSEGISFTKEWFDRQSPMVVYAGILFYSSQPESWELTAGKCEKMATSGLSLVAGYPLTSKTLSARDAYIQRWGEYPGWMAALTYDAIRFILFDAIKRAGTIETEAVINALEETSIETTNARNFIFTPSHDMMMGDNLMNPEADYPLAILFQWQEGKQIPVYPKKIMEEAGATYTFPDWSGPWDNIS
jgi:branched-chain amino acid transport system substrate-binding protein